MTIERYIGKFITADDATKIIDINTINDGCKLMKQAAEKLEIISKKIDLLREMCNREALSIGGTNMEEVIELYEQNTKNFYLYIEELAEIIKKSAQTILNREQTLLNEEAKRLDEKETMLHQPITKDEDEDENAIEIENEIGLENGNETSPSTTATKNDRFIRFNFDAIKAKYNQLKQKQEEDQ